MPRISDGMFSISCASTLTMSFAYRLSIAPLKSPLRQSSTNLFATSSVFIVPLCFWFMIIQIFRQTYNLLIDCLRLRCGENLLETRIASQRVPFPPQTKLGEGDATRIIRVRDRAGSGKETLDQRDRLVRLANECINQCKIGRPEGAV